MSIFFIVIIATIARLATAVAASVIASIMISEAAIALLAHKTACPGGIWTPGAALGDELKAASPQRLEFWFASKIDVSYGLARAVRKEISAAPLVVSTNGRSL